MAIYFGTYGHSSYRPYVNITVNSQNIKGNTSTVTFEFGMYKASANSASYDQYTQTYSYSIDGKGESAKVTYDFRSKAVGTYNRLFSVVKDIIHNDNGTKSINVTGYHPTVTSLNPGSISVSNFTLPTIPRAASIYSLVPNEINIGETAAINLTGTVSGFSYKYFWSMGSDLKELPGATFTADESFASKIPKAASGTCTIICDTYYGSTKIGSNSRPLTIKIPASYAPTLAIGKTFSNQLNGFNLKDVTSLTLNPVAEVKGGATITKFDYYINGEKPIKTSYITSGSTDEYTSLLNVIGNTAVKVVATDSRGYSATVEENPIAVYDYGQAAITALNAAREFKDKQRSLKLTGNAALFAVEQGNVYTYEIYARKRLEEAGSEVLIGSGILDNTGIIDLSVNENPPMEFPDEESFIITLKISDSLNMCTEKSIDLPTEIVTADFKRNAIAFGKYAEDEELLDCAWDFKARSITTTEPFFSRLSESDLGSLRDLIYPVGSIYMSANEVNPGDFIGGTWEAYATGRTLIGAGTGKDTAGKSLAFSGGSTGGEYSHTLTIAEMPSHTHIQNAHRHTLVLQKYTGYAASGSSVKPMLDATSGYSGLSNGGSALAYTTATNQYTGGSGAHNNLPPYITCFIWRRTA